MRLRIKFEPSLLSSAACNAGLQRAWFCAKPALLTVADLAAALVERFGLIDSHDKLVLAAAGYTLPPDAALTELLGDGHRVTVTRLTSTPWAAVFASKRSRQRAGGAVTGTDSDGDRDGNKLPDVPLSPQGTLALRPDGAQTSARSRSARRKAFKRARQRQLLDAVAKSTVSPRVVAAAAPPPLISWPPVDVLHVCAHDAAKSGSDRGDIDAAMQEMLTPANHADARYAACAEQMRTFQLWVAGDVSSDAEGEPCSETSALRVGDVITYRVVELSAAGIPQVSPRRRSSVSVVSNDDRMGVLVPHPEAARLGGLLSVAHFAATDIVDVADAPHSLPGIAPPYNPDGSLQLAFADLLHVRRCFRPHDGVLRAVILAPDAATVLSSSAAALAAARLTRAGGQLMPLQVGLESKSWPPCEDKQPAAAEGACVVASGARAAASVPAARQHTTRAAVRSGGMAGALARLRRGAADHAPC